MTKYEIFQPLTSSLLISLAKLVFNSVSYSKLVSDMHDVCHYQAQKLSLHHKQMSERSFSTSQGRTCFLLSFVVLLHLSFSAGL